MRKTALLLIFALLLTGCSFSVSTANITDAGMTTNMVEGTPVDTVTQYKGNADAFYAYGILNNAPDDTTIRFVWKYVTEPQIIDEVSFNSEGQTDIYVYSTLTMDGMWPVGDYSVEIYIDERKDPESVVDFSIVE